MKKNTKKTKRAGLLEQANRYAKHEDKTGLSVLCEKMHAHDTPIAKFLPWLARRAPEKLEPLKSWTSMSVDDQKRLLKSYYGPVFAALAEYERRRMGDIWKVGSYELLVEKLRDAGPGTMSRHRFSWQSRTVIVQNSLYTVVSPNRYVAAQQYGYQTKWCITSSEADYKEHTGVTGISTTRLAIFVSSARDTGRFSRIAATFDYDIEEDHSLRLVKADLVNTTFVDAEDNGFDVEDLPKEDRDLFSSAVAKAADFFKQDVEHVIEGELFGKAITSHTAAGRFARAAASRERNKDAMERYIADVVSKAVTPSDRSRMEDLRNKALKNSEAALDIVNSFDRPIYGNAVPGVEDYPFFEFSSEARDVALSISRLLAEELDRLGVEEPPCDEQSVFSKVGNGVAEVVLDSLRKLFSSALASYGTFLDDARILHDALCMPSDVCAMNLPHDLDYLDVLSASVVGASLKNASFLLKNAKLCAERVQELDENLDDHYTSLMNGRYMIDPGSSRKSRPASYSVEGVHYPGPKRDDLLDEWVEALRSYFQSERRYLSHRSDFASFTTWVIEDIVESSGYDRRAAVNLRKELAEVLIEFCEECFESPRIVPVVSSAFDFFHRNYSEAIYKAQAAVESYKEMLACLDLEQPKLARAVKALKALTFD